MYPRPGKRCGSFSFSNERWNTIEALKFNVMILTTLSAFLYALCSGSCVATDENPTERPVAILDNRITEGSISYKIQLKTNLSAGTFEGKTVISFVMDKHQTTYFQIHARDLKVTDVKIKDEDEVYLDDKTMANDDVIVLSTNSSFLKYTPVEITLSYQGKMREDGKGLYRSWYQNGGNKRPIAMTNFRPIYARTVFPCFDEPEWAADFTISIETENDKQIVLSNTRQATSSKSSNAIPSVSMPTYTTAFAVLQEDFKGAGDGNVKIWSRGNALQQTSYAASVAPKVMKAAEDLAGMPYPRSTLDMVAVPDVDERAIGNLGLTFSQESNLLYDEETSTEKDAENVLSEISKQIASQWFANVVYPSWWSHYWLSGAFATYFQYRLTDQMEPTWRMDDFFVLERLQAALFLDASSAQHSLSSDKKMDARGGTTMNDIKNSMDIIANNKGASILRMVQSVLPNEDAFVKCLQNLLKTEDKAIESQDLWKTFASIPGIPSKFWDIMEYWENNAAYPLINVRRNGESAEFSARLYTSERSRAEKETADTKNPFEIPISYTKSKTANFDNVIPYNWLKPSDEFIGVPMAKDEKWIVVNLQQTGYYRVNYTEDLWIGLRNQLRENHTKIHVLNRAQILDDAFSLAIDGHVDYKIPLDLSRYLFNEQDIIPWFAAMTKLHFLYDQYKEIIHVETKQDLVGDYMKKLMERGYNMVGFDARKTDDHLMKIARGFMIKWACRLSVDDCLSKIKSVTDIKSVDKNLREAVLCSALSAAVNPKNATQLIQTFSQYWTSYVNSNVESEKRSSLKALACVTYEGLVIQMTKSLLKSPDVPTRNVEMTFSILMSSPNNLEVVLRQIALVLNEETEMKDDFKERMKIAVGLAATKTTNMAHWKMLDSIASESAAKPERTWLLETAKSSADYSKSWLSYNRDHQKKLTLGLKSIENDPYPPQKGFAYAAVRSSAIEVIILSSITVVLKIFSN